MVHVVMRLLYGIVGVDEERHAAVGSYLEDQDHPLVIQPRDHICLVMLGQICVTDSERQLDGVGERSRLSVPRVHLEKLTGLSSVPAFVSQVLKVHLRVSLVTVVDGMDGVERLHVSIRSNNGFGLVPEFHASSVGARTLKLHAAV